MSLVGTFAAMLALDFSLNSLSLFGLVLAIGIVVDDAIVVVENVERKLAEGLSPRDATRATMAEVGAALVATTLVLIAVFVPTAFLGGISGQFYRQFALTIAFSTAVSTFVSLTLSPALAALLLRRTDQQTGWLDMLVRYGLGWFFRAFDWGVDKVTVGYVAAAKRAVRFGAVSLAVYAALLGRRGSASGRCPPGSSRRRTRGTSSSPCNCPTGPAWTAPTR